MKKSSCLKINRKLIPLVFAMGISFSVFAQTKKNTQTETINIPEETINRHSIGVGVGQTVLAGDFNELGENSITADVLYSYSASYSFDFLANLHVSEHQFRDTEVLISGLALGIKAKAFQFDKFSPFVVGGLGFYVPVVNRFVDGVAQKTAAKFTFGTHFGAGVDLRLNQKWTFGIMTHLHNPFDVKQDVGPEVEGSYAKVLLTSFYTF